MFEDRQENKYCKSQENNNYSNCDIVKISEMQFKKKFVAEAVFSDGTKLYRFPVEPMPGDTVCIRIRTAKNNADTVLLWINMDSLQLTKRETDELFDYFACDINICEDKISYYFSIHVGACIYYYNRAGVSEVINSNYNFLIIPGFQTPEWAKGAVFYQIFVDRFYNGDISNDVLDKEFHYINGDSSRVTNWSQYPENIDIRNFYGGDLLGVMKKLDYLMDLGVEVIYLNPIFVSPSNHKYDIQDYDYIDPHYGVIINDGGEVLTPHVNSNKEASKYINRVTSKENLEASNQLFIKLVDEIHKRGMKIILDGVFNHCGSFNKWLDKEGIYEHVSGYEKGAYVDANSPYLSFFRFEINDWPYNNSYDGWWGHDTLPKLNYEGSEKLREYIMTIARKWVMSPFHVDGWRLDVAADLGYSVDTNHQFWKEFRKAVKEANPNALILAEHYGDPTPWLQGDEWDTVMNYDAFMEPVTWFLTGMEKHSDDYREDLLSNTDAFYSSMKDAMAKLHTSSLYTAMNELSNHDHSRFLTRTNHKVGRVAELGAETANQGIQPAVMREAVVMQMTWVGAPTIYYGDEAGVCGFTDPDNRRTFPWGHEDTEMIRLHKEMVHLRKTYAALKTGSIKFLGGAQGVIYYARFDQIDKFIIIVNNNSTESDITIPVWEAGITDIEPVVRMIYTFQEGFGVNTEIYWAEKGFVTLKMGPYSSLVIKNLVGF